MGVNNTNQLSYIKTLMLLGVSTLSVLLFSVSTTSVINIAGGQTYEANTMIASTNIEGLSEQEAIKRLEEEVSRWQENALITLDFYWEEAVLPVSIFEFFVPESISGVEQGSQHSLHVGVNAALLKEEVDAFLHAEDLIEYEELQRSLVEQVALLPHHPITIDLRSFRLAATVEEVEVARASLEVASFSELENLIDEIDGYELNPNQSFSMNEALAHLNLPTRNNYAISIVSSAIYQAIVETNFEIVDRSIGQSKPVYTKVGFEAYVDEHHDFVVTNPNPFPYSIKLRIESNTLYASITGAPFTYTYEVEIDDERTLKPRTILRYSPDLARGATRTIENGRDGYFAKIYRKQLDANGVFMERTLLAEDFYRPVHRIVERSLHYQESNSSSNGLTNENEQNETSNENDTNSDERTSTDTDTSNGANSGPDETLNDNESGNGSNEREGNNSVPKKGEE
ncbi:hypothetical protein JCM9140_3469 [Halalkalibacter wakoensis JCM 9140]|uniref:G5 domain-containing protein n=1 Tax=Halalkalibacter wakoensis JCM 9140 TaxID=1236970 RepID=W4Q5U3_9BACI|nr:VanW family protein [Halalkalibacter wakoensis]GAE27335.1 hypothetical protein JCM9140_3469 [Halalkalibacter wakoensis JCM 9140]